MQPRLRFLNRLIERLREDGMAPSQIRRVARAAFHVDPSLVADILRQPPSAGTRRLQTLLKRVEEATRSLPDEKGRASQEQAELEALGPRESLEKVERARTSLRSPYLVDRIIGRAREELRGDSETGLLWFAVARAVALRVSVDRWGRSVARGCLVRVSAQKANALRILGRFAEAEAAFRFAESLLSSGATAPDVEAEVHSLKASLRFDQARFDQAAQLLEAERSIHASLEDREALAKNLAQSVPVLAAVGEIEEARRTGAEALRLLDEQGIQRGRVWLTATANLAPVEIEAGNYQRALEVVDQAMLRIDRDTVHFRPHLLWIQGLALAGLTRWSQAERALREAIDLFDAGPMIKNQASARSDLAWVLLESGREREAAALAADMVQVLQALELPQYAMAAFQVLMQSIRDGSVRSAVAAAREVGARLKRAPRSAGKRPS